MTPKIIVFFASGSGNKTQPAIVTGTWLALPVPPPQHGASPPKKLRHFFRRVGTK